MNIFDAKNAMQKFGNAKNLNDMQQSFYNAALLKIFYIDRIWMNVYNSWIKGDLFQMHHHLRAMWPELETDATDIIREDYYQRDKKIIENLTQFIRQKKLSFRRIAGELMYEQWLSLKRVENLQGMGKQYRREEDSTFI